MVGQLWLRLEYWFRKAITLCNPALGRGKAIWRSVLCQTIGLNGIDSKLVFIHVFIPMVTFPRTDLSQN